jgi:hypothetical protein
MAERPKVVMVVSRISPGCVLSCPEGVDVMVRSYNVDGVLSGIHLDEDGREYVLARFWSENGRIRIQQVLPQRTGTG